MSYFEDVLSRKGLQQYCAFILGGVELPGEEQVNSSFDRINISSKETKSILNRCLDCDEDIERIRERIDLEIGVHQDVYIELGMKVGAMLMYELMNEKMK